MTRVYFVRHAQPVFSWVDDLTRPLTEEGQADCEMVTSFFKDKAIDVFYSSPYKRSVDTIKGAAELYGKEILTDTRLRERGKGQNGNSTYDMFRKRWADHDYHEEGGESIAMVQQRNVEALTEILNENPDCNIVIGTHGTAFSTIMNYYDSGFECDHFLRIIDWMPYVIELDFKGTELISIEEHCYIQKSF